jgi:hypothetical protein
MVPIRCRTFSILMNLCRILLPAFRAPLPARSAQFNLFPLPSFLPLTASAARIFIRLLLARSRWLLGHTVKDLPFEATKKPIGCFPPRSTSRLSTALCRGGPRS